MAINASNDGLFDWNLETNSIYYSPRWKSILGYEDHEIPNDFSVWETATEPEDRKRSWELQHKLITGQIERFVIEFKMKHKHGHWVDILSQAKAVFDKNGKAIRMVGTHTDITDRKRAEEALRESEEKYRLLFLNMNSYNSLYDVVTDNEGRISDFRFIMVNSAYEKYVGKSASELVGKTLLEVYPATERYWIDEMTEVASTGRPNQFENFSKVMNTHTEINLFVPQKGQLAMTTGNIDKRKLIENELRESKQNAEMLLNVAAEIIISLDSKGDITLLNESGHRILGYESPELVGKNWFDTCLPVEEKKEIRKYFGLLLDGESTSLITHESDVVTKKEERKTILWHNSLLKDKDGKGIGLFSSGEDITDRIKGQRLNEALSSRIKLAMSKADIAWWEMDIRTGIVVFDRKKTDMLGYQAEDFTHYQDFMALVHPDDFEKTMNAMRNHFSGVTDKYEIEYRILAKSGVYKYFHDAGSITDRDNTGKPIKVVGMVIDISERKRAELELKESEIKYSTYIENTPDGMFVADENGHYVEVNKAACLLTGYSKTELLNMSIPDLLFNESLKEGIAFFNEVLDKGSSNVEVPFKHKDGSKRWWFINAVKLTETHAIAFTKDITESKKMETELVSQRRLYEQILEQSLAGYWDWDIPSGDQYLSPTFKKMFGYEDHEIENRADSWQKLIFVEDLPSVYGKFNSYVESRGKAPFYNEVRYHHKDGSTVWVICTGKVIAWDDDGNAKRMIGCHIDITGRKKIEEELQEQELKYRLITEHSADVIWVLSIKTGRFKFISPSIFQLRGFTPEEAMAETVEETMTPESIVIVKETMARDYKYYLEHPDSPRHNLIEIQQYCKNGDIIWVEVSTVYYLNSDGDIEVIGSSRNIEERKKNEQALRNSEAKVKSLLAEKELLLKEVHHRIKNNMNTVSSLLSIQSRNTSEPMAILALDDARNRIQSMSILYDKLYRSQDYTELSVNNYLSSILEEVVANFPNSQMVKVEKDIQDFVLDVKRLQSLGIMMNELLTNIMKYAFTGKEQGLISVSATKFNNHIIVSVQDDGIGVPESVSFENSTGFGLQLIYALAQQLEGSIRIERGNGARVVLEFDM